MVRLARPSFPVEMLFRYHQISLEPNLATYFIGNDRGNTYLFTRLTLMTFLSISFTSTD
jgi:hypothetical protein